MSYDMGWEDDHAVLVAQHVEGPPLLEAVLRAPGAWPAARVLRVIESLAGALGLAHERGVCHGALTAASVVVDASGAPALIDLLGPPPRSAPTPDRLAMGERAEPLRGSLISAPPRAVHAAPPSTGADGTPPTPRADVLALGHLLLKLRDAAQIDGRDPLSGGIAALLAGALAPRPEDRYESGAEMAAAITALLEEGQPLLPRSLASPTPVAAAPVSVPARPAQPLPARAPTPRRAIATRPAVPDAVLPLVVAAWVIVVAGLSLISHSQHRMSWMGPRDWSSSPAPWSAGRFDRPARHRWFFFGQGGGF
jgi:serine/threonine-protein kinase